MGRIVSFGCSITDQHRWRYLNTNKQKINYAVGSCSNTMQIKKYIQLRLYKKLDEDDVIIWQITNGYRHIAVVDDSVKNNNIDNVYFMEAFNTGAEILKTTQAVDVEKITDHEGLMLYKPFITPVIKDKNQYIVFSPSTKKWLPEDIQEIYYRYVLHTHISDIDDLLVLLIDAKLRYKKLLVLFGWDDIFYDDNTDSIIDNKTKVLRLLDEHHIDYIPTSILEYCKEHNTGFTDSFHPALDGYKLFTENLLEKKLIELGWLND